MGNFSHLFELILLAAKSARCSSVNVQRNANSFHSANGAFQTFAQKTQTRG